MNSKLANLLQMFRDVLPARNMEELEQRLAKAQETCRRLPKFIMIWAFTA